MAGSDACPVWLNQVVIGALPVTASRHNSPAHPHFLNKLVSSHLPCGDACIVVSVKLLIVIFASRNLFSIIFFVEIPDEICYPGNDITNTEVYMCPYINLLKVCLFP